MDHDAFIFVLAQRAFAALRARAERWSALPQFVGHKRRAERWRASDRCQESLSQGRHSDVPTRHYSTAGLPLKRRLSVRVDGPGPHKNKMTQGQLQNGYLAPGPQYHRRSTLALRPSRGWGGHPFCPGFLPLFSQIATRSATPGRAGRLNPRLTAGQPSKHLTTNQVVWHKPRQAAGFSPRAARLAASAAASLP